MCAIEESHSYQLPGQSKPQLKYLDNKNLSWSAMQIFINVREEVYHTLFTVGSLDKVVIFDFHTVWDHKNAGKNTCSTSLQVPIKTDFHCIEMWLWKQLKGVTEKSMMMAYVPHLLK